MNSGEDSDFFITREEKGHTYIDVFNLSEVVDVPEFENYYKNREKFPKIKYNRWVGKFGKDEVRFFEIAYKILKEKEKMLDDEL
tara:strand:- start:57 stop:308 length:252 start_codon:yes stop_codon:yes gene_type:complete